MQKKMILEPEREVIAGLFRCLQGTFLEGQLILGGSSGLFAFPTTAPAFTEDLDFLVLEDLVEARGAEIVSVLAAAGYSRTQETSTFTCPGRPGFDLVGYSMRDSSDHLSPPGPLQVMVFGDLGVVLREPGSILGCPPGVVALSPAGFVAVKLLTVRVEKGAKDKLQALLVVSEHAADDVFRETLPRILARFEPERSKDALADAHLAFLSLQREPGFRDHGAEGYAAFLERVESGYETLLGIFGERRRG